MKTSLTYESHAPKAVKRMAKWVLLTSVIGFGLYALVLAPLYTQLSSDIVYQESLITYLLYYAYTAAELVTFCLVFPATVYAVWRGGLKNSRSVWITFLVATVCKYLANFIMSCITDGYVPSWTGLVRDDLPIILPNLLLELGQYVIVVMLAWLIIRRRKRKWQMDVLLDGKAAGDERSLAFPITRLLSFKNPVQASAFAVSVFMMIARVITHLVYQLALLIYNGESDGALIITLDMISDVLLGGIIYFVMLWLMAGFDKREMTDMAKASKEGND